MKNIRQENFGQGFSSLLKVFVSAMCLLLITVTGVNAQTQNVTGKVTDASGQPVIGANITVVGTSTGVATDLEGAFVIKASKGEQLEISYIGMQTQKVTVGGTSPLNVILQEDSQMLDAAVVIGYGTAKKRDLTGSIVNVSGDEIANRPSSNPMASLQGKIAGVQIINTGRAGQDPEIRIRGTNSINGFAPLYVVDGLFTDNISYLNASDIESFEILKDPSSLAIFGVRGANGVIIVSTKRAKQGQTLVNVSQSFGFKTINKTIDVVDGNQFRELYNEQLKNIGANPFDYTHYGANTDWQDAIFHTAFMSQTNASVTGATEKNKFYLGVGYLFEEGNIKDEELQKVTVNFSSDYTAKRWLRFGVQMNGAYMLPPDAKDVVSAVHAAPISPIYGPDGSYYALPDFQRAQISNPMVAIENEAQHNIAQNYRMSGNVYGEVNFIPELTFRAAFSLDYASNNSRQFSPVRAHYVPEDGKVHNTSDIEKISQSKANTMVAQSDYVLTYKNTFAEKHNLTLTAGLTTNYISSESMTMGRSQDVTKADILIPNDPDKWWVSSIGDISSSTNSGAQYRRFTLSYLFRALYNYDNRYLLNASFRRDGASVFRYTGNTWDNFYSVGAG
ncbi:MAG: SusC/RagA family TonB-linked outer membrane protein, partial [Alistipes sp.]